MELIAAITARSRLSIEPDEPLPGGPGA